MHRVYAPGLAASSGSVALDRDEAHHLGRVVRASIGTDVILFDGAGREWLARVATVTKSGVTVDLVGPHQPVSEPPVEVTLAVGVLKGDQMDTVVRDATALGVTRIVPMATDHVVVPERVWRTGGGVDRWRRVAVASAKQCGRAVVPTVGAVSTLAETLAAHGAAMAVFCVEPARLTHARPVPAERPTQATLFIGPEGGWSDVEMAMATAHPAHMLALGPRTLRAEIAPTVALSALWATWGW